MHQLRSSILLGLIALLMAGCGGKGRADAEQLAAQYFAAIKEHNVDAVMPLYSPEFFQVTPEDKWRQLLIRVGEKLGPLQSYKEDYYNIFNMSGSGTTVTLQFSVKYEKYDAKEIITVGNAHGKFLITGHNINSDGLIIE
jgi:hypothetical protein